MRSSLEPNTTNAEQQMLVRGCGRTGCQCVAAAVVRNIPQSEPCYGTGAETEVVTLVAGA